MTHQGSGCTQEVIPHLHKQESNVGFHSVLASRMQQSRVRLLGQCAHLATAGLGLWKALIAAGGVRLTSARLAVVLRICRLF